jgi:hypothetical protein
LAVVHFAQAATPLTGHTDRLAPGLGKPRGIEYEHPIALSQVRLHLTAQLLSQGLIVPCMRANEALQRQTGLAKTVRNRFDIFALDIRQQTTDIGFGMLIVYLTMEDGDKGLHKGVQAWNDLLKNLRGHLTFVKQLGFTKGVSRFHGKLLLCIIRFAKPQK